MKRTNPEEGVRPRRVFVTGSTGYMGRRLIDELLQRGHQVHTLVRPGKESTLPSQCHIVVGNALEAKSYAEQVRGADTFVHLIGVPHPNPSKALQFRAVDFESVRAAVAAATAAGVQHFVYVGVAHPAPVLKVYWEVRRECEEMIRAAHLNATFLRPWYVLGPGHRWPYVLKPMYWFLERLPGSRDTARRLGLVTLSQMITALRWAVENPSLDVRILEVPDIRRI